MFEGIGAYPVGMSATYVTSLILIALAALCLRILVPGLPLRARAKRLWIAEVVLVASGVIGLLFHCLAMFFRDLVDVVPWTAGAVTQIREVGATSSLIWYIVPSVMVVVGVRRLHPAGVLLISVALVGVGVSMYDGGPLDVHLAWIAALVAAISGVASALVLPPESLGRRRSVASTG